VIYRDAITGKFITKEEAERRPDTSVREAQNIHEIEPAEESAE